MKIMPDESTLRDLFYLLRKDNYGILQFVPFGSHSDIYKEKGLPRLIEAENRLFEWVSQREPIIYEYSFSKDYYYNKLGISPKQKVLERVFLLNHSISVEELRKELPEYLNVMSRFIKNKDEDNIRFSFRIVPFYSFMIVADTLDYSLPDKVFLYRDSCLLSSFLRKKNTINGIVADIGTGSGCLAMIVASMSATKVYAVDINDRALEFARLNVKLNGYGNTIKLQKGSVEDILNKGGIDCMISNPPYMYSQDSSMPCCTNGGTSFGMDVPLRFVKLATRNKVRIIMIITVPISKGRNLFEAHLPKEASIEKKEIIEMSSLYETVKSHMPLINAGFTHREIAIYELVAASL